MGRSIGYADCSRHESIGFIPSEASDTNDFDEAVALVNAKEDS